MDLGCSLSTDGLVSVSSDPNVLMPSSFFPLESEPSKQRGLFQSSFSKHGRSIAVEENDEYWNRLKTVRSDPMPTATSNLLRSGSHSVFPDGEQMLNFSSWKPDALVANNHWNSPFFNHPSSSSCSSAYPTFRNAGVCSGNSTLNTHGAVPGIRGPFTTSQWLELEQQALIYKYIDAKMPIPSNLLMAVRRSINSSGLSSFFAGSYRPAGTLGWGNFHLGGFSGSADPEPGRCRRTDGKKWRCSRDAVVDQKYCERHMNRGRHRSRKRVEGHNGHAAKTAAPGAITSSQSASAVSSGASSNNLTITEQHSKNLQSSSTEPSSVQLDRLLMNRDNTNGQRQISQGLSTLADLNSKSTGTFLHISKQLNPFEETSTRVDLGLISTDSSLLNSEGNRSSENLSFVFYNPEMNDQHHRTHPFRHFIDDWSKNPSDVVDKKQSSRTELSISIPISSSDLSSSSSSANQDKLSFPPLRLSCEFNPMNDGSQRGLSWIPISWEHTIGGPLGEVLTNTSTTPKDLSASSLNLMSDGWNSKTRFESSPTGVLQESGFGSLSSSAGSSPRVENHKAHESDHFLGSTFANLSTNPSL